MNSLERVYNLEKKLEVLKLDFNELASIIYENSKSLGFHEDTPVLGSCRIDTRHILSLLMLVTTEVSEAAEACRNGDSSNFSEEIADVIIRVFDLSAAMGIDIKKEVIKKVRRNFLREYMHGGKQA